MIGFAESVAGRIQRRSPCSIRANAQELLNMSMITVLSSGCSTADGEIASFVGRLFGLLNVRVK